MLLLPVYYTNYHQSDTQNCISTLNEELRRQNIHILPLTNKNNPNNIRTYETILKNWKKKQEVISAAQHNFSFKQFVASISVIDAAQQ